MAKNDKTKARARRKLSIRSRIHGSPERPRLCVFRSAKHIYAQVVDDSASRSLCSVSTLNKEVKASVSGLAQDEQCKLAAAKAVGAAIAKACQSKGISSVVFDRSGYVYHGRVKALADAAREGGLVF